MTTIYGRAAWGAEHPDGFGSAPLPAREVWLHHSATGAPTVGAAFDTDAAAVRLLEQIGQMRFGGGISYTFSVAPSGRIFQGHSIGRRGAHTKGRNSVGRAIVLIGDYSRDRPGPAMVDAAATLLVHGHRAGWWTSPQLAGGHRDAPGAATACPGDGGIAVVETINLTAATLLRPAPDVAGPESLPTLRYGDRDPDDGRLGPIRSLQLWLNSAGWTPRLQVLVPDGDYRRRTRDVVAAAQAQCGVTGRDADGTIIGPRTKAAFWARGWRA